MMSSTSASVMVKGSTYSTPVYVGSIPSMRVKTGWGRRAWKVEKRSSQSSRLAISWKEGVELIPP